MKIPEATKLPSGKWRVQVMVDGNRVSVTANSKREAEKEAAALKIGSKRASAKTSMTVGDAIDKYIESKNVVLSPSTIAGYKTIRKNTLAAIAEIDLDKLTPEMVQRHINTIAKDHTPKTVQNTHGLLSAVLGDYKPDMALRTRLPQKIKHEISIPSESEIKAIAKAADGTKYELPIMLAIWLGLRQSEILGLKWEDVQGDYLHIRRALVMGENGPVEKGTKSYSGRRQIQLPDYLKRKIEEQPKTGEHIINLSGKAIYSGFSRICEKAGVPHYRFHDLRHVNASVMLALNVPDKYAMERMGHATNNMLKTVYQHTISEEQKRVSDRVDNYFNDILHTELHTK